MAEFFTWLDQAGHRYAVLRGFNELENGYPLPGSKQDVDLLVDAAALAPLQARYSQYKKRQGVKCDIHDVSGKGQGAYLGFSYFPPALAEQVLAERRMWRNRFYVPGARVHLLSLIYHIAYQKSERSGMDHADPEKSRGSKYVAELERLKKELGADLPLTLSGFHAYLKKVGYGLAQERLIRYLQNDFERSHKHQHKSFFLASVCHELPGEMNLFVIRAIAMKKGVQEHLLQELRKHYTVLAVKPIPWLTRLSKRGHMRGGKWKRGGHPHLAVVVFDPAPLAPTE
ncbi:MAG: hypothetical protein HY053_09760, partial [Proteobacteria bacterium]|nr:hypothetical protein [Pseudomonadota bacterium]